MPIYTDTSTVQIAAVVKAETDLAWLLDDGDVCEWVPKSQADDNEDGTFTLREWIAREKGFI